MSPTTTPRPESAAGRPRGRGLGWKVLGGALAALALAGVFAAYLRPELALDLAGRLWSCF